MMPQKVVTCIKTHRVTELCLYSEGAVVLLRFDHCRSRLAGLCFGLHMVLRQSNTEA